MRPIGLYIHVPFCAGKCPYCDFYSVRGDDALMDRYVVRVLTALDEWSQRLQTPADTLYFGGGTPSLLGGRRLTALIERAARRFSLTGAEITLEANPADRLDDTLRDFARAGGNRLSLGMQSALPDELRRLGRRHRAEDVPRTVEAAARAGIRRLSLDLMLGLEGQTSDTVRRTAAACTALGAEHVSAYLLKIEPHTPYAAMPLSLPDEEATAVLYETAVDALDAAGYRQYEISNFSRPGCESRHNLKYWNLDPYLGIGPAAHSFLDGRRFAYARDLTGFLAGAEAMAENAADADAPTDWIGEGSAEEYLMVRLRLTAGVTETGFAERFGIPIPTAWRQKAAALPPHLIVCDEQGIRLTRAGFLVSNAILTHLLA